MKNPLSILVPIDFSDNSASAYRFALNLAEYLDVSVKLLHVNTEIIANSRPINMIQYPSTKADLEQKLEQFAEKEYKTDGADSVRIITTSEVIEGVTVAGEIVRQSAYSDLIVVGAKGENLGTKKLFGSIPTLLAQKSKTSVLVIPMEAEFYPPAKILFASNWESSDENVIHKFVQWCNLFNAQANFLHITQEYAGHEYEEVKEEIFDAMDEYDNLEFSYLIIDKKAISPLSGIMEYAHEEEMDWVTVVNRQKGFFNNILGLSLTKEITTNPRNPILVLKSHKK